MAELQVIVVIVALVALNGLFVAAEFAIIGTSRTTARERASRGIGAARRVAAILDSPVRQDRFIATAQLGITLASLGLGMYGEHAVAGWFEHGFARAGWGGAGWSYALASVLAIGTLTYLHVVLGEMVPKSLALQKAQRTAEAVSLPMTWLQRLLQPLVLALNGAGNGLLRLMGVDRNAGESAHYTPEELEILVAESQRQGLLPELPGQLVRELLDFFELTAEQVMVPRVQVVGVPLGADQEAVAAIFAREIHTRYPIYDGDLDHVVGFVHAKDLAREIPTGRPVSLQMVREVPFVPGSASLGEVLDSMRDGDAQMAVVLDEHGGTAGILTVEDLLEELVGELEEEEGVPPEIVRLGEEVVLAAGTARLEEIGEELEHDLEHEDVDTVSGLVLDLLGRPPRPGDRVAYGGLELTVVEVEGYGVARCRIRRQPESDEAGD